LINVLPSRSRGLNSVD